MNRVIIAFLLLTGSFTAVAQVAKPDLDKPMMMSSADKKKLDRIELVSSFSELRGVTNIDAATTYRLLYNKTIGDFIYDAADTKTIDDTAMTIVTAGGKRLKRYVENFIDVRWFGANPAADGQDDYPYIQKAIDWVIKYRTHGTVYLPAGEYTLSKGLLIRKDENNDGVAEFVSIDLLGAKSASTDANENGGETILQCKDVTDFGIGVQKGKTMSIKNIAFTGLNLQGAKVTEYNVGNPGMSFLTDGVRNNKYSPYSAIVIDPFGMKAVLPENRYPKRAAYYTERSNAGSSAISVENCWVRGFAVGICNSPNGTTQNAECHNFEHLWIDCCKSAIVNCNSQARTVYCRDIKVWGGVECVFDHQRYGDGTSSAMYMEDVNIAGAVKYLIATTNWGIGYFHQLNKVHAESLWAIGGDIVKGGQLGNISLKNCQIDLTGENPNVQQRAPLMAWCNTLEIQDSYMGYYSASDGSMMFCNAAMVIMRNATGSLIHTQKSYENSVYAELTVNTGNRPYYYATDGNSIANDIQLYPGLELFKNAYLSQSGTGLQLKQKYCGKAMNMYPLNAMATVTSVDPGARKAIFKVGDQIYKCAPGAFAVMQAKDDFGNAAYTCAGVVTAVDPGSQTIAVALLSNKVTNGASVSLVMAAPAQLHNSTAFFIGDVAKGSNTISNITGDFGLGHSMKVGQYYNHPAFINGTFIAAVSANSITLSTPALFSETGAFVLNETNWENTGLAGETQATLNSPYNQTVFKEGDQVRMGYANNSGALDAGKLLYVCTKAGLYGSNRLPQFKAITAGAAVADNAGGAAVATKVEVFGTDANHAIPANVSMVELPDVLTTNRTITLPSPLKTGQTLSIVMRRSDGAKRYNLSVPVIDNATGGGVTQLDWGKTYDFYVSGSGQWLLIRKY